MFGHEIGDDEVNGLRVPKNKYINKLVKEDNRKGFSMGRQCSDKKQF